jgi:CubicO group peptidase (beta-lactamase class C family)
MHRWNVPGLSVAVVDGGEVVWSRGFGWADRESRRPMHPDTYLRYASISKLFAATAIFVLRDRGALSIDDPVQAWIPAFPSGEVSIRHLLCHGAGLQREAPGDMGSRARRFRMDDEVPSLLGDVRLPFPPMRVWKYSNLGYTLLGRVVEEVAACPFDRFVQERIFEPLGMTETTYHPADVPVERRATGYLRVPDTDWLRSDERIWEPLWSAAGGLCGTAPDLGRFASFLMGDGGDAAPLGGDTLEEMCTPQLIVDEGWTQAHGLGPMLMREDGRILAGHAGGVFSVAGWLLVARGEHVGAVCLTNVGDEAPILPIARELVAIAATEAARRPDGAASPVPEHLVPLLGRYVGDRGMVLTVAWMDDHMVVDWPSMQGLPPPARGSVVADEEGRLVFRDGPYAGEELIVERDASGRVLGWEACTYWYSRL